MVKIGSNTNTQKMDPRRPRRLRKKSSRCGRDDQRLTTGRFLIKSLGIWRQKIQGVFERARINLQNWCFKQRKWKTPKHSPECVLELSRKWHWNSTWAGLCGKIICQCPCISISWPGRWAIWGRTQGGSLGHADKSWVVWDFQTWDSSILGS